MPTAVADERELQLKVTLLGTKPPVWRRLLVREGITLADLRTKGTKLRYVYDFGDDWTHQIEVEAVAPLVPRADYPRCLAGRRACPPEDCGGLF